MIAIFKREFKSYATNMSGGIFVAIMIAIMGVMLYAINLFGASSQIEYGIFGSIFSSAVTIPLICMISYPNDKRSGGDKLLLSLPVSSGRIALAKYLAVLCWFAIPVAVMSLFPVLLGLFGQVIYSATYSAIIGYFLVGACMISICMYISSLCRRMLVAGGIGVLLSVFLYYAPTLAGLFENKMAYKILCLISPYERFSGFLYGMFDISSAIYLLSVTVLFLFLSAWSVDKGRR